MAAHVKNNIKTMKRKLDGQNDSKGTIQAKKKKHVCDKTSKSDMNNPKIVTLKPKSRTEIENSEKHCENITKRQTSERINAKSDVNKQTTVSDITVKSSKKWKSRNKLNQKKKKKKIKSTDQPEAKLKKDPKRVIIPKEISNNWKALHEVIMKNQKTEKSSDKPKRKLPGKQIPGNQIKKTLTVSASTVEKDSKVIDIWFDGVDEMLLDIEARKAKRLQEATEMKGNKNNTVNPLVKVGSSDGLTKAVAMDCEMVGVGVNGSDSMLARVSIVNNYGQCLYDKYVKPMENVVDYRTFVSGITPENIKDGEEFFTVQKEVSKIIKGRMLVGHALSNDLKVLYLQHDKKNIRDTSKYKGYRSLFGFQTPSLKKLTKEVLGVDIQDGEHDSVQDAQAAMRLYTMYRKQWEKDLKIRRKRQRMRNKLIKIQTNTL